MKIAMESVHSEFEDLCKDAKDSLENIFRIIDEYLSAYKNALDIFERLEYRKINGNIDNT